MDDRDAKRTALLHAVGQQAAELLATFLGLAAELYPDELRRAVGQVFDLWAVEEQTRRIMALCTEAQEKAHATAAEVRELVSGVNADLAAVEERIDGLAYRTEKGHRAIEALARKFNQQVKTK